MDNLAKLREMVEAATPGPWRADIVETETASENWNEIAVAEGLPKVPRFTVEVEMYQDDNGTKRNIWNQPMLPLPFEHNARLCAVMRNLAPALLDVVKAASALRDLLAEFEGDPQSVGAEVTGEFFDALDRFTTALAAEIGADDA